MKTQRYNGRIAVGTGVILTLLGLFILAFVGELRAAREPTRLPGAAAAGAKGGLDSRAAIYMNISGIAGECTEKDHMGWIDVVSVYHGLDVDTTAGATSPGGVLRPVIQGFTVAKRLDKASPELAQAVATGTPLQQVQVHIMRLSSTGARIWYAFTLHNAVVTKCHLGIVADGQSAPTEEVSLSFRAIEAVYTEYDANGAAKGTTNYMYKQ